MAGHQVFGPDSIGDWSYVNSTTVQLASSTITVGGLQYDTSNLQVSTVVSGVGGLDVTPISNNEKYYVYAVKNGNDVALIGSLSSTGPSGYTSYKQINSFYTNNVGGVFEFRTNDPEHSNWIDGGPVVISSSGGAAAPTKGTIIVDKIWYRKNKSNIDVRCELATSNGGTNGGDGIYLINMPGSTIIDTSKLTLKNTIEGRGGNMSQWSSVGGGQLNFSNGADANSSQAEMQVFAYSNTELGLVGLYDRGVSETSHGEWGNSSAGSLASAWYGFGDASTGLSMCCNFSVPVLGWDK